MRDLSATLSGIANSAGQTGAVTDDFIVSLGRGDANAMRRAYLDHHVAIRAFAQRLVGDELLAEDLVHDTFVALPSAIRRFRGECALRTFILGIVANHA